MGSELLSGNESIARGAWEAGATAGFGYPGTPSTETLDYFSNLEGVYAEWAPNEKVALEAAIGYSMAGGRALFTCKHVGLNVAADPLMTLSISGCHGGLVIFVADDPGMHSSQNEQDSRVYAAFAKFPMLEPSNSQEAVDMMSTAFELSESMSCPVIIRSTVRISHTKCLVETHDRVEAQNLGYEKNPQKWIMMPAYARGRRVELESRIADMTDMVNKSDLNKIELRDANTGFICSGAVYEHVREAIPEASVLKLGFSYPMPIEKITEFFNSIKNVYIAEEANGFFNEQIRTLGFIPASYPQGISPYFELSPYKLRQAMGLETQESYLAQEDIPIRPPSLCAGCPHRLTFVELKKMKAIVTGDIGCYTLGAIAPLEAVDSVIDMGASISMAHGFELGKSEDVRRPVFAVIGDSTFAHSGISSLLGTIYNAGTGNIVILDNRTTAMTGGQGNPVNGITLQNRKSRELNLPTLIKAMGVDDVVEVDAQNRKAVSRALKSAANNRETLSVVICKSPCVITYKIRKTPYVVDSDACKACGQCISIGCPAISANSEGISIIDPIACVGCNQCAQMCAFDAISQIQKED